MKWYTHNGIIPRAMVDEATWRAAACGAVAGVCAVQVFQVPKLAHLYYSNVNAILCVCVLVPIPLTVSSLSVHVLM